MRDVLDRMIRSIVKRVMRHALVPLPEVALRAELQRRATLAAADFVMEHMRDAVFCIDKFDHLTYAIGRAPSGLALEFGVFKGTTINHLARQGKDRHFYGFDSFRGLPEEWAGHRHSKSNFDRKGRKPKVLPNVTLVEGWFEDTLPAFVARLREPIAFAHLDCDIYSSTKTVLTTITPRLASNAILVFDEFFNYKGYDQHEHRAFFEFIETFEIVYSFIGYSGQQVSVKVEAVRRPAGRGNGHKARSGGRGHLR